jgi:hypothetical protein
MVMVPLGGVVSGRMVVVPDTTEVVVPVIVVVAISGIDVVAGVVVVVGRIVVVVVGTTEVVVVGDIVVVVDITEVVVVGGIVVVVGTTEVVVVGDIVVVVTGAMEDVVDVVCGVKRIVIVSVPVFPAASLAVRVMTLFPSCRVMSGTDQLVVPEAEPEPPLSLDQVAWVTPKLSEDVPPIVMVLL